MFLVLMIAIGMIIYAMRLSNGNANVKKARKGGGIKDKYNGILLKSYLYWINKPITGSYIYKIRARLETIHQYDEFKMRREAMEICYKVSFGLAALFLIIVFTTRTFYFIVVSLCIVMILHDTLLGYFIDRLSNMILKQQISFFNEVRHNFHEHGMVEEAIFDACDNVPYEISLQGEKIYKVLIADNVEDALQNYYDVAPNRYLKAFSGVAYLAREFGDKKINGVSLFLKNLNYLVNETNMEILKREKLNYTLKSLTFIAATPVLLIKPIEKWARGNFPTTNMFYDSGYGFLMQVFVFAIVFMAYLFLRKIQENDDKLREIRFEGNVDKLLKRFRFLEMAGERFAPKMTTKKYLKILKLIKEANGRITVEKLYIKRVTIAIITIIVGLSTFWYMHIISRHNLVFADDSYMTVSVKSITDEERAVISEFDKRLLLTLKGKTYTEEKLEIIIREEGTFQDPTIIKLAASRIKLKLDYLNNEYLKWYEVLIVLGISAIAYFFPIWMLYFQRKLLSMEKENEVMSFQTLIIMLMHFERISVENIIEWLYNFSTIFKDQILKALNDYDMGIDEAMEELKESVEFPPLIKLIEDLQAADKTSILQAFDELESEREFFQQKRKFDNERIINTKSSIGKLIGFIPLNALFVLYLIAPLAYASYFEMLNFYNSIMG